VAGLLGTNHGQGRRHAASTSTAPITRPTSSEASQVKPRPPGLARAFPPASLTVSGLVKRYGGLLATDNVDLELKTGRIHALIGPNGAGKSTLIGQLSGEVAPDAGCIKLDGHDITELPDYLRSLAGLKRSYQITSV